MCIQCSLSSRLAVTSPDCNLNIYILPLLLHAWELDIYEGVNLEYLNCDGMNSHLILEDILAIVIFMSCSLYSSTWPEHCCMSLKLNHN